MSEHFRSVFSLSLSHSHCLLELVFSISWLLEGGARVENNILKTKHSALIRPVFPNQPPEFQTYFYFGNTNSTFVVNPNLEEVPTSADNPMISPSTRAMIIRSNRYTNAIYSAPAANETLTMSGVVSFNTTGLIQVYAGLDNIPYTSDEVSSSSLLCSGLL